MARTIPEVDADLALASANIAALQSDASSLILKGRKFYVNPDEDFGSDSNPGSKEFPFLTLEKALSVVDEYDAIGIIGTISEDDLLIATPHIAILGLGPTPYGATLQNTVADKVLLTVGQPGCLLANFRIRPPAYDSGTPAGIMLSGAGYTDLFRLRFQGKAASHNALYSDVTSDNVKIRNCEFLYMNTATYGAAIKGVAAAGTVHSGWVIEDCLFSGNVIHIAAPSAGCRIRKNTFGHYGLGPSGSAITTTTKIDLSGSNAGYNNVNDNDFGGTYSHAGGYQEAANDNWAGNRYNNSGTGALTGALPA